MGNSDFQLGCYLVARKFPAIGIMLGLITCDAKLGIPIIVTMIIVVNNNMEQ